MPSSSSYTDIAAMAKASAKLKQMKPSMFSYGNYGPITKLRTLTIEEPDLKTKKLETERPPDIVQPMEIEGEPMEIDQPKTKTIATKGKKRESDPTVEARVKNAKKR